MNILTKLCAIAGLAIACFVTPIKAASMTIFSPQVLMAGGTNNIAALSTNTFTNVVLNVENQENVALQVSGSCLVSNKADLRLDFAPTVDGTTYATTNLVTVTVAAATNANTGAIFCVVTNIACPGIRSLKLVAMANTGGLAIPTNITVTGAVKR